MTLQNGMIFQNRSILWSDSRLYQGETGLKVADISKIAMGTIWPWAVSLATVGGHPHDLFQSLEQACPLCLDSLLAAGSDTLKAHSAKGYGANLLFAAWERQPHLYLMRTTDGLPGSGERAFEPIEVYHFLNLGAESSIYPTMRPQDLTPASMLEIIDETATRKFSLDETLTANSSVKFLEGPRYSIGGDIWEVAVSKHGVEHRVVRSNVNGDRTAQRT